VTTAYIITFIGDDRPGLVEQLSSVIENNGGNWHESRLSQLGGKFAGLVLISLPSDNGPRLEAELKGLADSGISVRVTPTGDSTPGAHGRRVTLSAIGPDRLGIVKEIARTLASRGVNVVEMDSEVSSAPMSGEQLFQTRIDVEIPDDLSLDDLADELDEIANQLTLEIEFEDG
jgi:glycine cleavage system regulatory protein